MEQFSRTELVLNSTGVEKLSHARILIVGLGGVGGAALEMLVRAGVGNITMVDGDVFSLSNLNRQLGALHSNLGRNKAEVWAERCREINPGGNFTADANFLRSEEKIKELLSCGFDAVVDAIDETAAKTLLLSECAAKSLFTVSSMGAGGKRELVPIQVADISKTHGCPLAKIIRKNLRDLGVKHGIKAVFSPEQSIPRIPGKPVGSLSYIVAAFGLYLAREVIEHLTAVDR